MYTLAALDAHSSMLPYHAAYHVLAEVRQAVTRSAPLQMWDRWSRPYIERIIQATKREHPTVPITVYANGSGGLLERLGSTGADVVGLDWTVDMADARARLGPAVSVQACADPGPRIALCRARVTVSAHLDGCMP